MLEYQLHYRFVVKLKLMAASHNRSSEVGQQELRKETAFHAHQKTKDIKK